MSRFTVGHTDPPEDGADFDTTEVNDGQHGRRIEVCGTRRYPPFSAPRLISGRRLAQYLVDLLEKYPPQEEM
jgi:hypothetical protein